VRESGSFVNDEAKILPWAIPEMNKRKLKGAWLFMIIEYKISIVLRKYRVLVSAGSSPTSFGSQY